uniref:Putative zn2+-dependent endopeptidase insulinase superfamily protein n=1 Tax=Anopheles braziliensis TaxID=58242 RepID=A0A2M3Z1Z9_9DIPT
MGFQHLVTAKANEVIQVHKYRSNRTGLTVVVGEVEGPVVNGYFTLATEACDDDGLPHTLEHLIFLGSEKYPYKGILDLVANRCLASGTNAWTDRDHTCYTMTTAGSEGFLTLLPVYLDHILYPTLTDAGFLTEVHHISGEGIDGGVVYCEMQGRENTGESRANLEMLRAAYPNCGYSAETGGIMSNLRTSTSNEKVRAYHTSYYRPDNLYVIITGQIRPEDIFAALEPIEQKIISKGVLSPFTRPWQTPVAPLTVSKDLKVEYPADEEDCGLVNVAWLGPESTTEYNELTDCSVLLRYLTDTSASPIQRDFIENENPHASSVSYSIVENSRSLLYIGFENVPLGKEDGIFPKLNDLLISFGNGTEKFDMTRMTNVIERYRLEALSSLESNPHDDIAFHLIGEMLYGTNSDDFEKRLNVNRHLKTLKAKEEDFWVSLLNKYFVNANHVVVRAVPSVKENLRIASAELLRIEEQRKRLAEDGLKEKSKILAEAMAANDVLPPNEMITSFPVPSAEAIKFYPVEVFRSSEENSPTGINLPSLPFYAEAYDLHTNFCYLKVSLNTSELSAELRPYLVLLVELLTESPVRRGNTLIPYEEVVAALESNTVETAIELGFKASSRFSVGSYGNNATLHMQVVREKYVKGIELIGDLLYHTTFTAERIKVCATKLVNEIAQLKREGNSIAREIMRAMRYHEDSNVRTCSLLKQSKFLTAILSEMEQSEFAADVIAKLNKVRAIITLPENISLHMAADWQAMEQLGIDLNEPWKQLQIATGTFENPMPSKRFLTVPDWKNLISTNQSAANIPNSLIVTLGSVESAFLFLTCRSISDFQDPDLVPLLLSLQYLTQLEGPLWRHIRGQGFAYGYNIVPRPNEGLLYFTLYRASNVAAAFKEAMGITRKHIGDQADWDDTLLESARSSLIYEIIARENSIEKVVDASVLSCFKNVPLNYNQALVLQVREVTKEDLIRVSKRYLEKLFSNNETCMTIVCHPDKASDIETAFGDMGISMKVENSLEDSILA